MAFDRIKEAFEQVAQDEARNMSIVQDTMIRSTDHLRRIIAPVGGQGGVKMFYPCPHCNSFTLEDNIWWVGKKAHNLVVWTKIPVKESGKMETAPFGLS